MKTLHSQNTVSSEKLFKLERCGSYEAALAELESVWTDTESFPNVEDLPPETAAEIILRCGSLIGFHGHNKQIANAQEISKNLLTEARRRFLDFQNVEKTAECENYLALAYWRTGEAREAEVWIEESLSHDLPNLNNVRLHANIIKCLIYLSTKRYDDITLNLQKLERDFRECGDNCLKGDFYNNYGLALKNLGKPQEALKRFEIARFFHRKSHHKIYLGTVENNLAQLYKSEKLFAKAHQAIDSGTKIFKQIKDRTREGFSLDTKAQIFFAEKKYPEALQAIEKAIRILKKGENKAYLVETFLTKAKILLYSDDFVAATLALFEAVEIAKIHISEDAAAGLVREFESELSEKNKRADEKPLETENDSSEENLELILPASIAHYSEIQAVRIKNSHLENAGLTKDSLAIVALCEVERGDLVAVSEIESDSIVCGFYDFGFGLVCIEAKRGEPQLFDEKEIKILGKIVGFCNPENNAGGKLIVEPVKI
jgi:tetratricopeptide (TPR) repeat protein